MRLVLAGLAFTLAACAAPQTPPQAPASEVAARVVPWQFEAAAPALRLASCPDGTPFERALSLAITATAIDPGPPDAQAGQITGMRLAGAWHLTAEDSNFGGLSGLATLPGGSLLAVSDAGAWVWIGIDPDTGVPDGIGSIAYMKGADGKLLSGKTTGDAEGLAFRDGLALVSFERDHRIEAFDLEGCGAGAKAARVADLPSRIDGQKVPSNQGAEALTLFADGSLRVGFEFAGAGGSPAGMLMADGTLGLLEYSGQPGLFLQTGIDKTETLSAQLFRAYDPIRGNRNLIYVYEDNGLVASAKLDKPLPVDNFEGIAFATSPDGNDRIWLIADDNFSKTQRTLLFAFDLD